MVHGRGGSAADLLTLADDLNLSAFAYVAPQADGHTWYPHSFLAPVAQNQPYLEGALARLETALTELAEAGIPAERVAVLGFSQGACLASEFVARRGGRFGALVLFSGGLITLDHTRTLSGTPVFIGNSDRDAHIPLARHEQTVEVLTRQGAQVDARIYPGMPHTIIRDELDAARNLLRDMTFGSL